MAALFIGLMSGTSMDGIDAALVDFSEQPPQLIATHSATWPATLLAQLQSAASGEALTADAFALLDAQVGEQFALSAKACQAKAPDTVIAGIGSHGQTLAHHPDATPGYSLQIGNAARIAEDTGVTTVNDFRSRDIAAGGQGAPLVPAFHAAALDIPGQVQVVLNIGGIANISVLTGDAAQPLSGFDTGPGNCLLDQWTRRHFTQPYDKDGLIASSGQANQALLQTLLSDPYFAQPAPKSTGTDYFSLRWLEQKIDGLAIANADISATLLALTAQSICQAIEDHAPVASQVLVCGGGVHNQALMQALTHHLPCPVRSTSSAGIDPDWMESMAFAWLAREAMHGRPGNISTATGAKGPRILGAIHPA